MILAGEHEWSFGYNASNRCSGYPISISGTILRMSLSSVTRGGSASGEVNENLVLNGVEQKANVTKDVDLMSAFTIFDTTTIKLSAVGDINFVTTTGDLSSSSSVAAS